MTTGQPVLADPPGERFSRMVHHLFWRGANHNSTTLRPLQAEKTGTALSVSRKNMGSRDLRGMKLNYLYF